MGSGTGDLAVDGVFGASTGGCEILHDAHAVRAFNDELEAGFLPAQDVCSMFQSTAAIIVSFQDS
jgi:hypothetical protein